jgi:hypothetical protein
MISPPSEPTAEDNLEILAQSLEDKGHTASVRGYEAVPAPFKNEIPEDLFTQKLINGRV